MKTELVKSAGLTALIAATVLALTAATRFQAASRAGTATPTLSVPQPATFVGERDPKADLEGQMMYEPNLQVYLGG